MGLAFCCQCVPSCQTSPAAPQQHNSVMHYPPSKQFLSFFVPTNPLLHSLRASSVHLVAEQHGASIVGPSSAVDVPAHVSLQSVALSEDDRLDRGMAIKPLSQTNRLICILSALNKVNPRQRNLVYSRWDAGLRALVYRWIGNPCVEMVSYCKAILAYIAEARGHCGVCARERRIPVQSPLQRPQGVWQQQGQQAWSPRLTHDNIDDDLMYVAATRAAGMEPISDEQSSRNSSSSKIVNQQVQKAKQVAESAKQQQRSGRSRRTGGSDVISAAVPGLVGGAGGYAGAPAVAGAAKGEPGSDVISTAVPGLVGGAGGYTGAPAVSGAEKGKQGGSEGGSSSARQQQQQQQLEQAVAEELQASESALFGKLKGEFAGQVEQEQQKQREQQLLQQRRGEQLGSASASWLNEACTQARTEERSTGGVDHSGVWSTEGLGEQQQQQQQHEEYLMTGSDRWREADPLADIESAFDEQVKRKEEKSSREKRRDKKGREEKRREEKRKEETRRQVERREEKKHTRFANDVSSEDGTVSRVSCNQSIRS
eukprot:610187-Pelagomonas_calceolata.AAC.2